MIRTLRIIIIITSFKRVPYGDVHCSSSFIDWTQELDWTVTVPHAHNYRIGIFIFCTTI